MGMKVIYTKEFEDDLKRVRDRGMQMRIKKSIQKIMDNPSIGKPLRYELSGLRSLRIPPFRIIYELKDDLIILHKFEHRKRVYE